MFNIKDDSTNKLVPDISINKISNNQNISIKEIYQSLKKNQLLHCHLMLKFL